MIDKHEEHVRDSAYNDSRFAGYCKGDLNQDDPAAYQVIGRMRGDRGLVTVTYASDLNGDVFWVDLGYVTVGVFFDRLEALEAARQLLKA